MKNLKNVEEKLQKIEETEGSWKIKEGSYYYINSEEGETEGMTDDYFKDFVFPHSVIGHQQCGCEMKECNTWISLIFLISSVLVTDRENLVRVS